MQFTSVSQAIVDQNIYTFRIKQSEINQSSSKPLQDKQNYLNKQSTFIKQKSSMLYNNINETYTENQSVFSKRQYLPLHRPSIILKGKHVLPKYNFKQNSCHMIKHDFANINHQYEMPKLQKEVKMIRNINKIKTETKLPCQINELNICPLIMQKELFQTQQTTESNSCVLNFTTVRPCLQNLQRKSFSLKKQNDLNHSFQEKISQSRGLQLFAKLYVRNRFELIEKPKNKKIFCKAISQRSQDIKQNLDIRKISPLQKEKKKKLINHRYESKRVVLKNICTTSNKNNNFKQFYELSGWQNAS